MIKFRILIVLLIFSCGTKKIIINSPVEIENNKKVNAKPSKTNKSSLPVINNVNDYIDYFSGVAMDEMRTYKIPASITLAQGILESGSGKGRLSVEANNHFGIKCHDCEVWELFSLIFVCEESYSCNETDLIQQVGDSDFLQNQFLHRSPGGSGFSPKQIYLIGSHGVGLVPQISQS